MYYPFLFILVSNIFPPPPASVPVPVRVWVYACARVCAGMVCGYSPARVRDLDGVRVESVCGACPACAGVVSGWRGLGAGAGVKIPTPRAFPFRLLA